MDQTLGNDPLGQWKRYALTSFMSERHSRTGPLQATTVSVIDGLDRPPPLLNLHQQRPSIGQRQLQSSPTPMCREVPPAFVAQPRTGPSNHSMATPRTILEPNRCRFRTDDAASTHPYLSAIGIKNIEGHWVDRKQGRQR